MSDVRSMTGFGEAGGDNGRYGVTVGLRAVNHRFLDLQIRLPEEHRGAEVGLRELLGRELVRGRVEMRVDIQAVRVPTARVQVNEEVVGAVAAAVRSLSEAGLVVQGLTAGDLLRLPAALQIQVDSGGWEDDDQGLLLRVAGAAVGKLVASRRAEGESLASILLDRVVKLGEMVAKLEELRIEAREELAAGLRKRLDEALQGGVGLDESRLAQEVAVLVDRSDVSEEVDRLRSHLQHFRQVTGEGGAIGKRLDFLTQEIFRELNTLGSKCRHAAMTRNVLDAKVVCEEIREQVQNVE